MQEQATFTNGHVEILIRRKHVRQVVPHLTGSRVVVFNEKVPVYVDQTPKEVAAAFYGEREASSQCNTKT